MDHVAPNAAFEVRLLDEARRVRHPGRPLDGAVDIDPLESFERTAASLDATLTGLSESDGTRVTALGSSVHELVTHLVGVERFVGSQLGLWLPDHADGDGHVAAAAPSVTRLAGTPLSAASDQWRECVAAVISALRQRKSTMGGAMFAAPADFHGLPVSFGDLLIIRTFEMWTHEDDIRRTIGQPLRTPDVDRLRRMTALAVQFLPAMLAMLGLDRPTKRAQVVLTGPGGGSWTIAMSPNDPDPDDVGAARRFADVRIIADTVEFCRLAASRCTVELLGPVIEGDAELAASVLTAVGALAVD